MSHFDPLRQGVERALDTVSEGWRHLTQRAGHALTRFRPVQRGEAETPEERREMRGAHWGLLAAEVHEDDDRVEVELEAPGLKAKDFDIEVHEDRLFVRGEKRVENDRREGRFHVMERAYGAFERVIPLPAPVDQEGVKARYRNGVLYLNLPKSAQAKPRRITVEG